MTPAIDTLAIDRIDHIVLNCRDVEATALWYQRVLGMRRETFGPDRRVALRFGRQKINLRPMGAENWITGAVDAPGSADLCFIGTTTSEATAAWLRQCGVAIVDGAVARAGALGEMTSLYCRDPDGNLVEIAHYGPPSG